MFVEFAEFAPDTAQFGMGGTFDEGATPLHFGAAPAARGWQSVNSWRYAYITNDAIPSVNDVRGGYSAKYKDATYDFVGDSDSLYFLSAVSEQSGSIEDKSSTTYATPVPYWDFTQYGQYVIAVNGGTSAANTPQVFDMATSAPFADLGGSPPKAKTVSTLRDFVVLGHTYDATDGERPTRVRWSAFGDHTSWTPNAATQADLQDLQSSFGTVQRVIGGEDAYIACSNGVAMMRYVGPPEIFKFDYLHPNIGTLHGHSCVRIGDHLYMYAKQGFVRLGPQRGDVQWIGAGRVDRSFISARTTTGAAVNKEIVATHDPQTLSVRWFGGGATAQYCYSYAFDKWWAMGQVDVAYPYESDIGEVDGQKIAAIYGVRSEAGGSIVLYGEIDPDGAFEASLPTGFIQLNAERRSLLTRIRPVYDYAVDSGAPKLVVYRYNDFVNQDAWEADVEENAATVSPSATDGVFHTTAEGRFHNLVLKVSGAAGRMNFLGLNVDAAKLGRY